MATSASSPAPSAKRKREEEKEPECFEIWRKTTSAGSIAQEKANVKRWFYKHNPELWIESAPGERKSLEEMGDLELLEEYYRQEFVEVHKHLEQSFYDCGAVTLACRLLGKFLYNRDYIIICITETEAYEEGDSIFKAFFWKRTFYIKCGILILEEPYLSTGRTSYSQPQVVVKLSPEYTAPAHQSLRSSSILHRRSERLFACYTCLKICMKSIGFCCLMEEHQKRCWSGPGFVGGVQILKTSSNL